MYAYQVGGSLAFGHSTYVERQADIDLYSALLRKEFCYVLTSRQMGKSSLRLRMKHRLEQAQQGYCASIDMTRIGSHKITPQQWYRGIAFDLLRTLKLTQRLDFKTWWAEQGDLSPIQIFSQFIEDVLLTRSPEENIFIFVDEIDSVKSLEFDVDDFFALIRFCHNQRAENPAYNRLTWALFGVAAPSTLIVDSRRTPFNIGRAIDLSGFSLEEAQPLVQGLVGIVDHPQAVFREILTWTRGQPFLTQKLCHFVQSSSQDSGKRMLTIPPGTEAFWVENLVRSHLIDHWEAQDEPEHLRTIRDRLLADPQQSGRLLGIYQRILHPSPHTPSPHLPIPPSLQIPISGIKADGSPEQTELMLSGLVANRKGQLQVANQIYAAVFDGAWIEQALAKQRPYYAAIATWAASQFQDESRLLRGQALEEAQAWAKGKSLSNLDYQFLAASQTLNQQTVQQALATVEERNRILTAAHQQAKRAIHQGRMIIMACTAMGVIFLGLAGTWAMQAAQQKQRATLNEITSMNRSAESLLSADQPLNALLESIRAGLTLRSASWAQTDPRPQTETIRLQTLITLQQMASQVKEQNRLVGHTSSVRGVAFSPDGQMIATTSYDQTVKLWQPDGKLLATLTDHQGPVWGVSFSPNGQTLASASSDHTLKLWHADGTPLRTFKGHTDKVWGVAWSPDGDAIASVSADHTLKLWHPDGTLLDTLTGHAGEVWGVAWSPDGQLLASAGEDRIVRLWSRTGVLLQTLSGHTAEVNSLSFSPDGQLLASASYDGTVKVWNRDGNLLKTLTGHAQEVYSVSFSPDGARLASTSLDKTVQLWRLDDSNGLEIMPETTLTGHTSQVFGVSFSPDGKTLASTGFDQTAKLWQLENTLQQTLVGHHSSVRSLNFAPDGQTIMSASWDETLKLWQLDGTPIKTLGGNLGDIYEVTLSPTGDRIAAVSKNSLGWIWDASGQLLATLSDHSDSLLSAAWSPDGQVLATTSADQTVKLWTREGVLLRTLSGHRNEVWGVDWSPDGTILATASTDKTIKLWTRNGILQQTLVGHTATVSDVSFSPDGQTLASAGWDQTIHLWDRAGRLRQTLTGHSDRVWSVSFSPDGQRLASASNDQTVKLWHTDGTPLITLVGHQDGVADVSFSPDGNLLASASLDERIILWHLDHLSGSLLDNLLLKSCGWVKNYLSTNPTVADSDRTLCQ
ncbi:MAG: AAA-like domain-containing protein [Leptolyngbya sp. SIO1E4]|nr:AAA-like domain-containing protein [Leptolyngbya sp. SIO1E4]